MAGTLPGVECARRRRFRGSSLWSDPSFMINSAFGSTRSRLSYEIHLNSTSSSQRSMVNQSDQDGKLGGVARKAKERLDGRLRRHWKSEITRYQFQMVTAHVSKPKHSLLAGAGDIIETKKSQERSRGSTLVEEIGRKPATCMLVGDLQMEVFGVKKSGSKRFNWGKIGLNWKSSDQDECAVCLDRFNVGEKLCRLPCAHRFHYLCLLPWLESHAHCPCCRTGV